MEEGEVVKATVGDDVAVNVDDDDDAVIVLDEEASSPRRIERAE